MFNSFSVIFNYISNEIPKEHNSNQPEIPDHPYRISKVGGSGSGRTNAFLHLINNELDIDKIYLCVKDPSEAKYQIVINK